MYPFGHAYILKIILFGFKLDTVAAFPFFLLFVSSVNVVLAALAQIFKKQQQGSSNI